MINCLSIIILILLIVTIVQFNPSIVADKKIKSFFSYHHTTIVKGVAILLILIGHVAGTMDTVVFTPLGGIGVAMFLIASGYGINESYKKKGISSFWRKKILRVLLPYAIEITFFFLFLGYYDIVTYILNYLGIKTKFWFVAYIIKCYIAFWIAAKLFPSHRLIVLFIFSVLSFLLLQEIEAEQSLSFFSGVAFSEKRKMILGVPKEKLLFMAISFVLGGILALIIKQIPEVRHSHYYLFCFVQLCIKYLIALGLFVICFYAIFIINSRFLYFSGTISYELFLLQMPFYEKINGSLVLAFSMILLLYPSAWVFYKFNTLMSKKFAN